MAEKDRITLPNDQQTTIAIGFARDGKTVAEPGDKLAIASSAVTVLAAIFNAETGLIDVIPVDGATGSAGVTVTATLADGTVLPAQTVSFDVTHPDADALVLTEGALVEKTASIPVPKPNAEPVVIPAPPEAVAEHDTSIAGAPMKYRVTRTFQLGGRQFLPGDVVDASDVGADAVAGFVDSGFLEAVPATATATA